MSNQRRSQAKNEEHGKKISSWDDAIADAKQRVKELQFSIGIFRERKRKGEPWPLKNEKAGTADAIPA